MSESIMYAVPAIHCVHRATSIRAEVSEVEGVWDVAVDLDAKGRDRQRPRTRRRRAACGDRGSGVRRGVSAVATREPGTRVDLALEGMTCAACANPH